jgi:outer membrane protein insertion porin family
MLRPTIFGLIFLIIIYLISFDSRYSFAGEGPLIKSIEIKGNRKISTDTILSKMKSKVGSPFSKKSVQEDIKKLYAIGYFDDIRVEIEVFEGGIKLIYIFTEKPTIISLDFQGNEEFEAEDLKEKITITSGAIANSSLILDNAQKIVLFYQSEGYWLVKVVPIIRKISEDAVALTFQINEGPKVKIKKITFEGNKALSSKEIKKVMKTKEWWIFSFLTGSGIYRKDLIEADIERIRELYHRNGYIYVAISEPKVSLSDDRKKLYLTISISEEDQYKVGNISIKGNTVFTDSQLYEQIEISTGQIFNRTLLRSDIDKLIDMYMEKGYALVDINPVIDVEQEKKVVNITFSITEGGVFRIGRIDITGNVKTRDKVIRREMRLDEGDIFNKKLLKRSYQRINNLNYFESVNISSLPRAEDQLVDINIKVKEKLTGMMSIGGGYSSIDKFMVMGEVTQTNLFGKGLYLKLRGDFSSRKTNYNISLRDPWFMDKPLSASISLYNQEIKYPDYDKKASGGSIGFGKEFSEYVGGSIEYNLEEVEIMNVSEDASSLIKEQEDKKVTSSISPSIWEDTRDYYLDPSSGSRKAIYITLAGLGGDNYFVKGWVDSVWYFPVIWDTTFSIRARYGYATGYNDRELPLYERFYVGGINTIRGLDFGEGGPRNEEGEKIGGTEELIFNFEYIFPIIEDIRLKGVIFFDYGGAFDENNKIGLDNMRETTGVGVRWMSPVGPVRLEWGYNIDPKEDENDSKFEFSIGGIF